MPSTRAIEIHHSGFYTRMIQSGSKVLYENTSRGLLPDPELMDFSSTQKARRFYDIAMADLIYSEDEDGYVAFSLNHPFTSSDLATPVELYQKPYPTLADQIFETAWRDALAVFNPASPARFLYTKNLASESKRSITASTLMPAIHQGVFAFDPAFDTTLAIVRANVRTTGFRNTIIPESVGTGSREYYWVPDTLPRGDETPEQLRYVIDLLNTTEISVNQKDFEEVLEASRSLVAADAARPAQS